MNCFLFQKLFLSVLTFDLALWDLVSPHADTGVPVVGQAGGALVAARLSVPTIPEGVTLDLVREDTVQSGAVGCADGGFCATITAVID